jgi:membrane-associated phospholipid phosphatase
MDAPVCARHICTPRRARSFRSRTWATGFTLATSVLLACSDRVTDPATASELPRSPSAARSFPTGLASVRWLEEARSLVASHVTITPLVAVRVYSLISVAQYGAVVDAGDQVDDDGVLGPNVFADGGRRRFEAERGAVAGASARIMSYLFPDAAAALEQRVIDDGNAGPGGVHPQFTRGVAIGRAFGDVIIEWAKNDGFSRPWTGTIPAGQGFWFSAPGVPPAGPQFAAMTPYFLTSPGQFHPPPPPAFGSAAYLADIDEVSSISATRTPAQVAIAVFWNLPQGTISPLGYWDVLATRYIGERGFDERAAAHVLALTNAAALDAAIGCWEAKYSYFFIRPSQANPAITLPIGLPNHPSYPSGHSCVSSAVVEILSGFFPEHTATLDAQLAEAGLSRIYAGIHYRFDITAGQTLGRSVARWARAFDEQNGLLSAVR